MSSFSWSAEVVEKAEAATRTFRLSGIWNEVGRSVLDAIAPDIEELVEALAHTYIYAPELIGEAAYEVLRRWKETRP